MFTRTMILALTAASVFTSASALADSKSYAGYSCLTHSESVTRSGSKFVNTDTTSHTVACPVVRDSTALGLSSATVYVVDQHFTSDVTCTMAARSFDGSSVAFSSDASSGTNANTQGLSIGALPFGVAGHYTLYCTLPAEYSGQRSSIVSYWVNEN